MNTIVSFKKKMKAFDRLAAFTAVVTFLVWSVILQHKYAYFGYYDWDLGLYSHVLWNLAHGSLDSTLFGGNFLTNHAEYIAFLMVPFFWLFSHPMTLVLFNVLSFCCAAFVLYRFARHFVGPRVAYGLMCAYILYPANVFMLLYEFHFESLALPFIFLSLYYFFVKPRIGRFALFCLLAALTKENVAGLVGFWGIYALFAKKEQKWLWALTPIVIGWGILYASLFVLIPALRAQAGLTSSNQYVGLFLSSGTEQLPWLSRLWREGQTLGSRFYNPEIWSYMMTLFGPVQIVPFLSPGVLLLGLPLFLMHICSLDFKMRMIFFHYAATVVPIIFIAVIFSLRKMRHVCSPLIYRIVLCVCATVMVVHLWGWMQNTEFQARTDWEDRHDVHRRRLVEWIPQDAGVVATFESLSALSQRKNVFALYAVWMGGNVFSRQTTAEVLAGAPWAVVDFQNSWLWAYCFNGTASGMDRLKRLHVFFTETKWRVYRAYGDRVLLRQGAGISLVDIDPRVASFPRAVNIEVEQKVRLTGVTRLTSEVADEPVIPLHFSWEAMVSGDAQYGVDLVLVKDNVLIAKEYHIIGYAVYPTALWQAGQRIEENYFFPLPPRLRPGEYQILISFSRFDGKGFVHPVVMSWEQGSDHGQGDSFIVGRFIKK